jgi:hypothetical protein
MIADFFYLFPMRRQFMTMRDLNDQVDLALCLSPAARTNGTFNGTTVDLRGYDSAMITVTFGAYTDGTHAPSLQHSDDGVGFVAVAATDLTGILLTASNSSLANSVQRVSYLGSKRFVRGVLVVSGATTGALSDVSIVRGHPRNSPLA